MNNKTRNILLIVLVLVVAVIASRPLWQGKVNTEVAAVSGRGSEVAPNTETSNGSNTGSTESKSNEAGEKSTANGDAAASGQAGVDAEGNSKADQKKPVENKSSLVDLVNGSLTPRKPAVLVFTYNADCCPSTKEYFEKHKAVVRNIEQKYSTKANFVWIDIAYYEEKDKEGLMSVAKKYDVSAIPALVLIDSKGIPQPVILGEIDEKQVEAKMEGLVKGT